MVPRIRRVMAIIVFVVILAMEMDVLSDGNDVMNDAVSGRSGGVS